VCIQVPNNVFNDGAFPQGIDPMQGQAQNCGLIAALASVAWATNKIPSRAASASYTINFPDAANQVTVNNNLSYDANASPRFRFARSCSNDSEIWPGIYEKAYARWRTGTDYCDNLDQVPLTTWPAQAEGLVQLTGCTLRNGDFTNPYSTISNKCSGTKIRFAMVAWTQSGLTYGLDQMIGDHTYSVLGIFGTDYIVLKNPKGIIPGTSSFGGSVITSGNWGSISQSVYNCATGALAQNRPAISLNFGNCGIFALHRTLFTTRYFRGYAWVGPL
jgi:hypothetical protein